MKVNNSNSSEKKKGVAILGSTGSIGRQALEVIAAQHAVMEAEVLCAHTNADLLIEQSIAFHPNCVVIADHSRYQEVKNALHGYDIKVYAGMEAICQVVAMDTVDIVLTAMVGFAGLQPTLAAIKAGKNIALANKETLVVAGDLITRLAQENGVNIYPVDSEHSAIFQCLAGEWQNKVEKICLTASGGPFRGKEREFLQTVTKEQALKHPNWNMGAKVTIDSATLMNKGLEVIEAKWLFGLQTGQIEVIIHPQSIIHSIVQFDDGSMKAQMGLPDMRLPIQYALGYPKRYKSDFPRFDFTACPQLTFERPDTKTFRNLDLAYEALNQGGNMPCILNAANEVAVAAFLDDKIHFLKMAELIELCMGHIAFMPQPTIEDYMISDHQTRECAAELIRKLA